VTRIRTELAGTSLPDKIAYYTVRCIVTAFNRTWCRMSVHGREHVPRHGIFVLAPVHRSILDTPIASGLTWRHMRFMGADKYWKQPAFGRLLTALGGFPVSRGTADREALRRSIELLESGQPLVLFPEGERKSGPVVQPLFEGAAYVAVKAGAPIVPVGIAGSERAMPKGAKFIAPRKVRVEIGPPLHAVPGGSPKEQRAAARELTERLRAEMQRLMDLAAAGL
jgi:1-acyl-sn-glycerol-3-phosphate acyltransferase